MLHLFNAVFLSSYKSTNFEGFIYLCGASLPSKILHNSPEITCRGLVETTYYKVKSNTKKVVTYYRAKDTHVASQKEILKKFSPYVSLVLLAERICCRKVKKHCRSKQGIIINWSSVTVIKG